MKVVSYVSLNSLKYILKEQQKQTKICLVIVIMTVFNFLSLKQIIARLTKKKNICINVFCFENNLFCPVHISDQKFTDCMNLLLITDENKSHYVYIKDLWYMFNKLINKNKKHFFKYCFQCFSTEKENCLKINGKQSVKLRIDTIKFKNH